ncbi:aerotolerance protein [Pontibacter diazotrophicus]|uniref:Aerotolerance protein n=1 Tax=Pontibacter diazotrophicus TaxID=1400979 RepID=A0A3D8L8I2_9BACT|nr:aerotolerance protein [Pontibacter diazotrophicus]RDV13667.1 aerotolerance protein [Pontibacter diazotrophicus]
MKPVMFVFFLVSLLSGGFNTISRLNEYAKTAATAYAQQDYVEAIAAYEYLLHDLEVKDDQLQLNLAHAYYKANLLPQAAAEYRLLADHPSLHLKAVAHLQLGNIATQQKKYRQALALYKNALIAEPLNDAARYNYELLKKYLALHPETPEETPEDNLPAPGKSNTNPDSLASPPPAEEALEPQPKQNPDANGDAEEETEQPQPDNTGQQQSQNTGDGSPSNRQDKQSGDREREQKSGSALGDTEGLNPNGQDDREQLPRNSSPEGVSADDQRAQMRRARLQQMNMSPEKARLLLDAMRNAELQYIQQLPKKSTRTPDGSKPNW